MDDKYWQKLQTVFDEALYVAPDERDNFLAQACGDDADLFKDIASLLDAHVDASRNWEQSGPGPSPSPASGVSAPYKQGDNIGHHEIVAQIGVGGMGVVYQAYDSHLERNVALKFLPSFMHSDDAYRQRFMAEARAASKLDHPNICVIHDIDETPEGHMYITMPHYEGETLASRLKRGCLNHDDALSITIQTANGLAAAHAQEIVHRDIKPANIMLTRDGTVKILDFGIAKVADIKLTSTGMGVGTIAYMAPEQMHGQEVDGRADIWALGVTFYEMLTGRTAFEGDGTSQVVEAVLNNGSQPADSLSSKIPQAIHAILLRAMQRNRDARYPDMSQMLGDCLAAQRTLNMEQTIVNHSAATNKNSKTAFEWEPAFLQEVVNLLLPVLGPITQKLVHRQARRASNVEELCSALEELLNNDESRHDFREKMKLKAAMNTTPPAPNQIMVSQPSAQLDLTPVQLAQLESCLLPHLGPISGSLIRRALATTGDADVLSHMLTESIPTDVQKSVIDEIRDIINA